MDRTRQLIILAQEGDVQAKETIITENSGLIWSIVRKFKSRGYEMEDLYQIGAIGLLKCIEKFDLSYDVKFSTYAVPMIMGEIKRFIRDDGMIKVSRPLKELAMKARYIRESMTHENGSEPTISQLAEKLEVSTEDLVVALDAARDVESIFQTVYHGEGKDVYLLDKLTKHENCDNELVDIITLKGFLSKLSPKERQIIVLRYFCDKTQSEIAKVVGISQVQVSRVEKKIIGELREKFQS